MSSIIEILSSNNNRKKKSCTPNRRKKKRSSIFFSCSLHYRPINKTINHYRMDNATKTDVTKASKRRSTTYQLWNVQTKLRTEKTITSKFRFSFIFFFFISCSHFFPSFFSFVLFSCSFSNDLGMCGDTHQLKRGGLLADTGRPHAFLSFSLLSSFLSFSSLCCSSVLSRRSAGIYMYVGRRERLDSIRNKLSSKLDDSSLTFGAVTGLLLVPTPKKRNQFWNYSTHP